MANLAANSAMAKIDLLPELPKDKPFGKLNKAAPQGDYSLKATVLQQQRWTLLLHRLLQKSYFKGKFPRKRSKCCKYC
jgi:hypothetical protein